MTVKIIGLIVGVLVLGAGLYYLVKEKKRPGIPQNLRRGQRGGRRARDRLHFVADSLKGRLARTEKQRARSTWPRPLAVHFFQCFKFGTTASMWART